MKKTLILGASENTSRYSYKAAIALLNNGHKVELLGKRKGTVKGVSIFTDKYSFSGIHTVTLYLNPENQRGYYDYILSLKPDRVIFNPGTENVVLENKLIKNNIEVMHRCTLVMLAVGDY